MIPDELSTLKNLTDLQFQDNLLTGPIPSTLGLLTSLVSLQLQNNQFTGVIPTALDTLTVLNKLQLEGNSLTGTISESLCARRGDGLGQLSVLTVDCSVECSCCDFYEENCG